MRRKFIEFLRRTLSVGGMVLACALILLAGAAILVILVSRREPPAQAVVVERAVPVQVQAVHPEDVPVVITGFGEVRPLDVAQFAPQVSGQVLAVHPRLEVGAVIPEGEVLFEIEATDYASSLTQARAQVAQGEATLTRLRMQQQVDQERLETLARTRELARGEFERLRELLEEHDVGTRSGVDAAEMQANQARDAYDQLHQAVRLYPTRLQEAEAGVAVARAQLELASVNLARTEVRAPLTSRLSAVQVKPGQFVRAGEPVLTLVNDAVLEISIPLESRDARRWLRFSEATPGESVSWFGALEQVPVRVYWTEDREGGYWEGTLDRVERFEDTTRQVTVAVRVTSQDAVRPGADLPLVEGMYCAVEIPGKEMQDVYRLPRWAVSFEGRSVHLAVDSRLKMREVEVLRNQGDETFVSGGLEPGDLVVTTRLVDPLPNTLLDILPAGDAEGAS